MLLIKSKYKVAKRLGASVFEKTQTQKFALSAARNPKKPSRGGRGGGSDYGKQLLEKQRVRFTYGLSERQLSNYAEKAFQEKDPGASLNALLETRADNVVYRAGLALTRRAARQIVSHGHILVNGTRITIPSYHVRAGDVITVREGSKSSPLFARLNSDSEENEKRQPPEWVGFDASLLRAEMLAQPRYVKSEGGLDYATVFEFYSR
ncbi:MAG: small subunit ribosomal protein [Candidatus Kaiserbacteria bacterium]|nr:small subunit ribosomal protein [Candidatus Kaiserbacteria bacterium]